MPRIRILPDILANKIAAGEVVERPASVVKELVENALDAGSDRIFIDIENGGRTLIQVADNGHGMDHDDALLAVERFATSKLHRDEDLAAIRTLGFRGEALPSIAAVSHLTLTTRSRDREVGVAVHLQGGKIVQVTETGAAQGTLVRVERLFFNTPARRKFLKTAGTEMGHIADHVAGMALGYPQVHVKLVHNGKTVKQWTRAADGAVRAADVLGALKPEELTAVSGESGPLRLSGYLAPVRLARSTSRGTFLFVNGRRVRDRVIQHALFEGFRGRLMKGQFPLAALFLELPFDQVDVNVHPTKHEIRFVDSRRVHALVQQSVSAVLSQAERRLWGGPAPSDRSPADTPAVAEPRPAYRGPTPAAWTPISTSRPTVSSPPAARLEPPVHEPAAAPDRVLDAFSNRTQTPLWKTRRFSDLTVIGQFRGTYILCQEGDSLILIDQHAAHERVVYEHLARGAGRIEVQQLLMPETVELGFAEAEMLEQLIEGLRGLGLEIEPFGGTTFVVKAVPSLLADEDVGRLVRGLAERSAALGMGAGQERILDACRMVMACHNAVRAKQPLADAEIRHLLEQLDRCEQPSYCPHGRPTWIRWTLRDLEKAFGRVG
ncbi:DNA mismatch repair endonuclease MutL [Desulfatitalea tepidiphila]|uniref:DNA mismatch repair endonuclease MutL n=1 Tax=Desulfatitalea tepidiphila TaxID=1185843 RepID=UPI0006B58918|nr:DNA mismatch repair endonuclease MutL [Desulfatitalea tepidiphila]